MFPYYTLFVSTGSKCKLVPGKYLTFDNPSKGKENFDSGHLISGLIIKASQRIRTWKWMKCLKYFFGLGLTSNIYECIQKPIPGGQTKMSKKSFYINVFIFNPYLKQNS